MNYYIAIASSPRRRSWLVRRYLAWRTRRQLRNYQTLGYITDEDWYGPSEAHRG